MIFAGLDLSLTGTGYCLLDENGKHNLGTISTKPSQYANRFTRIDAIRDKILDMLPDPKEVIICIETPFVHPDNMAGQHDIISLAYSVRHGLYHADYLFYEVAATQLKKFAIGKGAGKKSMIIMQVYKHWDVEAKDDNQADATVMSHIGHVIHLIRDGIMNPAMIPEYQREVAKKVMSNG